MPSKCSRIPSSRAAPTREGSTSPFTPDTHVPSSPSKTCQPNPDMGDERKQTKASLLSVRGRREMRDGYENHHRSLSNESSGKLCYCSSGSRASSCSPQTPSFDRSAVGLIHTLSNPTSPCTSFRDLSWSFSPVGSPPYDIKQTLSQPYSHVQSQPINNFGHDIPSIPLPAPSCDFNQHPASLHPCPSTPSFPKQRCSSSPPSFRQLENTRKEHSGTPLSQTALSTEHRDCVASDLLTPDSNTLSPPSITCHTSLGSEDGQVQPTAPSLLDVSLVDIFDDASDTLSSMHNSPSIPPPTPPRNHDQHSASLHPRPPTPFYPK